MPLYTFKCKSCNEEFDQRQSLEAFDAGELPKHDCKDGNKSDTERVISPLKAVSSSWASWRR